MSAAVFQRVEQRVRAMRTTVAEIQSSKPGLGLPGNAEETLTAFAVVNQLQALLLDLEKVRPPGRPPPVVPTFAHVVRSSPFVPVEGPSSVHPAAPKSSPVQGSDHPADRFFSSRGQVHL